MSNPEENPLLSQLLSAECENIKTRRRSRLSVGKPYRTPELSPVVAPRAGARGRRIGETRRERELRKLADCWNHSQPEEEEKMLRNGKIFKDPRRNSKSPGNFKSPSTTPKREEEATTAKTPNELKNALIKEIMDSDEKFVVPLFKSLSDPVSHSPVVYAWPRSSSTPSTTDSTTKTSATPTRSRFLDEKLRPSVSMASKPTTSVKTSPAKTPAKLTTPVKTSTSKTQKSNKKSDCAKSEITKCLPRSASKTKTSSVATSSTLKSPSKSTPSTSTSKQSGPKVVISQFQRGLANAAATMPNGEISVRSPRASRPTKFTNSGSKCVTKKTQKSSDSNTHVEKANDEEKAKERVKVKGEKEKDVVKSSSESSTDRKASSSRERVCQPYESMRIAKHACLLWLRILLVKPILRIGLSQSYLSSDRLAVLRMRIDEQKRRLSQLASMGQLTRTFTEDDLRKDWEQLSKVDKQKYYQRAARAFKVSGTRSPKRPKLKAELESVKGQSCGYEEDEAIFLSLPEQDQNRYLDDQLRHYRATLSKDVYDRCLRDFRMSFNAVKGQQEKFTHRELKRFSRKLLYGQIHNRMKIEAEREMNKMLWGLQNEYDDLLEALVKSTNVEVEGDDKATVSTNMESELLNEIFEVIDKAETNERPVCAKNVNRIANALKREAEEMERQELELVFDCESYVVPDTKNTVLEREILTSTLDADDLRKFNFNRNSADVEKCTMVDDVGIGLTDSQIHEIEAGNGHEGCRSPGCVLTDYLVSQLAGLEGKTLDVWLRACGLNDFSTRWGLGLDSRPI